MPERRAARLQHGINASRSFAQVYDATGYTPEQFETASTAEDIARMKSMGFDHVRLSVNSQPMFPMNRPTAIRPDYLGLLVNAVQSILDRGLSVAIDICPESDFKEKLAKNDDSVQQFADFWRVLAAHYSSGHPDHVFCEILNQPEMPDRYRGYGVESKLVIAIREAAPAHTIIAAGARWSDDDDLVLLEPLRDSNVTYNFHFYEPHIFTHQGANRGSYYWQWVKGLGIPRLPSQPRRRSPPCPMPRIVSGDVGLQRQFRRAESGQWPGSAG